jgi:hypothetical protein
VLILFPLGVPLLYLSIFYRNRHTLRHIRRIELMQEKDYRLALLQAQGAQNQVDAFRIKMDADVAHAAAEALNDELREELPTALRRLTAGYEMRTYWFARRAFEQLPVPPSVALSCGLHARLTHPRQV